MLLDGGLKLPVGSGYPQIVRGGSGTIITATGTNAPTSRYSGDWDVWQSGSEVAYSYLSGFEAADPVAAPNGWNNGGINESFPDHMNWICDSSVTPGLYEVRWSSPGVGPYSATVQVV